MLKRVQLTALLGLITLIMTASTALSAEPPKKITTIEGITEYRLENGLRVLLFPDNSKPTVTVNLTIFVGSRHEGYGEAGMAHLLEHMLFKGTPTHPKVPKVLQERGARFNGTTWLDRTNYYETLPSSGDNLEFAIRLEADRMVNSFIKPEDLESEMTVVRNEFERGENSPSRVLSQRIHSAAFDWHNYGKSTIGNRSDIERVPVPKLRRFYQRHYQPDNAMLIIAGDFKVEEALAHTQKYFGGIPKPDRQIDRTYTEEPAQDGERIVKLRRTGDVAMVGLGYHIPPSTHEDFAAVRILSYILAMEPGGILYKAMVETEQASSVSGYSYGVHDPGLMMLNAEVREKSRLDEVAALLIKTVEDTGKNGVSEEDVDRARAQILKAREQELANSGRLAVSLSDWASQGDWRLYFLYRDRIEKVTAEDVKRVAARYLVENNRTTGLFIPTEKPQQVPVPPRPDLASLLDGYKGRETIAAGEKFDATPANIEKRTTRGELASGIKYALLPKKSRGNVVVGSLTIRYGDAKNLQGLVTACRMLPTLMLRGAGGQDYLQLQDALDKSNSSLRGSGSAGAATFSFQTKRKNLPALLDILSKVLRDPALPEKELDVLRRERLALVERVKTDPQYLANYRLRRTLQPYPENDVRYTPTLEEQATLYKEVSVADVKTVYNDFLSGQHGEVSLVGDFDPETVLPVLEKITSGWETAKAYQHIPDVLFADDKVKMGRQAIVTPGKKNAVYFAGLQTAMRDDHPDYPAMLIGNFILGGGSLSSRLGDRVRQVEGLSYSVSSHFTAGSIDKQAQFTVAAIANPDNGPRLAEVIDEEIKLLLEKGVTGDELQKAIQGLLQGRRVSRTTDGSLTSVLKSTLHTGRTMKFFSDQEEKISKLSTDEVVQALRKYIKPARMVVISAGDFNDKQRAALEGK